MSELLNCPFCGGEAEFATSDRHWIWCKNCGVETEYCYETDDAIKAWNTRKPMDRIVERLEAMKMRYFLTIANTGDEKLDAVYEEVGNAIDKAIEIIKEEGQI